MSLSIRGPASTPSTDSPPARPTTRSSLLACIALVALATCVAPQASSRVMRGSYSNDDLSAAWTLRKTAGAVVVERLASSAARGSGR